MGIMKPEGCIPNVRFVQWIEGYQIYDVTQDSLALVGDVDPMDGSELRLHVNINNEEHEVPIITKKDFDEAVALLKQTGLTDEQIATIFENLGIEREVCEDAEDGDESSD